MGGFCEDPGGFDVPGGFETPGSGGEGIALTANSQQSRSGMLTVSNKRQATQLGVFVSDPSNP
jgi:hypothetical protein